MKLRGLLPFVLLLGSAALPARGQVCSPEAPLRRTLAVNVLDKQGNLVRGLTAADFRASFRDQPVKIVSVTPDKEPRRVVILLDISDSMTMEGEKWRLARDAVQKMVSLTPPEDSLALVLFGTQVAYKVGFGEGREAVLRSLDALGQESRAAKGYRLTALHDSTLEALALFDAGRPGDVIYAVTDGGEGISQSSPKQVEQALLASGMRLFVFLLHDPTAELMMTGPPPLVPGPGATAGDRADRLLKQRPWEIEPEGFGRIAQTTGGRALTVYVDSPVVSHSWKHRVKENQAAALDTGMQLLRRQMAEFYVLEFEFAWQLKEPQGWKLEVVGADGKRRKDLEVVYPRKLVPCATTAPPTTAPSA